MAISETTRLSERGAEVVGVWEPAERRVVVRRDQLADAARYCGTLLHELTHARFGYPDLTFEFEEALSAQMGSVAHAGLSRAAGPAEPSAARRQFASAPPPQSLVQ